MNEYLRRIDERDYLTEREHKEYLKIVDEKLRLLEIYEKNAKQDIEDIRDLIDKLHKARKNAKRFKKKYLELKEVLEILKPYLQKVLEINEDGTEVFFKATRFFNGYVVDINGNWNETEQIKKNKLIKNWLEGEKK